MSRFKGWALALSLVAAPAFAVSFDQADRGIVRDHDVHNSLTLNPFGLFSPGGFNLKYERSFSDKISGIIGARVQPSRDVNPYALNLGADYFLMGRRNEGLYLGPRLNLGLGAANGSAFTGMRSTGVPAGRALSDAFIGAGTYRDAVGGELGYNWISARGLTLGLGGGVNYGFGSQTAIAAVATRWEPYAALNVGFSW